MNGASRSHLTRIKREDERRVLNTSVIWTRCEPFDTGPIVNDHFPDNLGNSILTICHMYVLIYRRGTWHFFLHLKLYQFQQPHLWNVGIPTLTVLFQEKPSIQQQNNDFFSTNLWYLHFPAIKTSVQVISSNDGWNIWKNHLKPSQTEVFQSKNIFFSGSRSDLCHLPPRLSPAKAVNFGRQVANPSRHTHADELQCWRKLLSDGRIDDDGYLYTTQRLSFSPNAGN